MGAAAAVLPAAGAAVGIGAGMTFGLSASTVATVTTVATVAGGVAIGSCGLFAASSIVEQGTSGYYSQIPGSSGNSYNPVRDSVFGGNQGLYDTLYMASSFATAGVIQLGASNIGLKPQKPEPSDNSGNKAVVIGEGMDRVKTATRQLQAEGVNARWYQAWSKNFPEGRKMTLEELNAALARNQRWIDSKIMQGYDIYDIGIDSSRGTRSMFYELEQSRITHYGYPTIDISGGCP